MAGLEPNDNVRRIGQYISQENIVPTDEPMLIRLDALGRIIIAPSSLITGENISTYKFTFTADQIVAPGSVGPPSELVRITSDVESIRITIKSAISNRGKIFIGKSTIGDTTDGYEMDPSDPPLVIGFRYANYMFFYGQYVGDYFTLFLEQDVGTPTVPSAPLGIVATPGNTQIILTWTPPAYNGGIPITGYQIWRSLVSGNEILHTTVTNVLTYTDTGLTNGTTYYYKLKAVNPVGASILSTEVSATPLP